MRTRRRTTIQDLRQAIDCLPRDTRIAMLEGLRSNDIIVGAYTNGGGICPMLAAHRAGGRTSLIGFAKTWDRFAFAGSRVPLARRATRRELLILSSHLEASLLEDDGPAPDLAAAMREHRALVARKEASMGEARGGRRSAARTDERPGDPDRSHELRTKPGWSWMRPFRRYDEYERALSRLESEHEALQAGRERELARD
jgi:hypothetical protein